MLIIARRFFEHAITFKDCDPSAAPAFLNVARDSGFNNPAMRRNNAIPPHAYGVGALPGDLPASRSHPDRSGSPR